jgi:hypothetical protein
MDPRIALTVDLEPDWGVAGTRAFEEVTPRFLRFLEERGMRATFFVVSDLMDASEGLVAELGRAHEIASHGCGHRLLDSLDERAARAELMASRERLEGTGHRVEGFRAPFFRRRRGLARLVREAGYRYDASMGSVMPGPWNRRLGALPCPFRRGGIDEFPTSAMARGMLPLSLTWLRLLDPLAAGQLRGSASMLYLHLHEFLPAETAACLPAPVRWLLTRNCGEAAWPILDRAMDALGAQFVACRELLERPAGES